VPEITECGWIWLPWLPPSGQDVDPDILERQRAPVEIELQIAREIGHMRVEHFHQIGEDRKAPGQIGQRRIRGIAGIAFGLAPLLPGLVIPGDGIA